MIDRILYGVRSSCCSVFQPTAISPERLFLLFVFLVHIRHPQESVFFYLLTSLFVSQFPFSLFYNYFPYFSAFIIIFSVKKYGKNLDRGIF